MFSYKHAILLAGVLGISAFGYAGQDEIDQVGVAVSSQDIASLKSFEQRYSGYDKSYASYQLAIYYHSKNKLKKALALINSAIEYLTPRNTAKPIHPEHVILLAQLHGYKAGLDYTHAQSSGQKAWQYIDRAQKLAPENPRFFLVKAILKSYTPAVYGGSSDEAVTLLNQSITAFEKEDKQSGYYWGYADAYIWRGKLYKAKGNTAQARKEWESALIIDPQNDWAKQLLSQ